MSGTVAQGQTITIAGSGFGTKSPARPIVWEDFEKGASGQSLATNCAGCNNRWVVEAACTGTYSAETHYGIGGLSAKQHLLSNASCWTRIDIGSQRDVYFSYRFYVAPGGTGGITKFARIASGDDVHSTPRMGYTGFNPDYAYLFTGSDEVPLAYFSAPSGTWTRDDYWVRASSPDVADGFAYVWRDGALKASKTSTVTRTSSASATAYSKVFLPYYNENGTRDVYIDQVYIDNTQARIEICSASTFPNGNSTAECELQLPTAWGGESVQFTASQGRFTSGQQLYLYVVNASGQANATGLPISFGSSSTSTTPPDVSGLRRTDK